MPQRGVRPRAVRIARRTADRLRSHPAGRQALAAARRLRVGTVTARRGMDGVAVRVDAVTLPARAAMQTRTRARRRDDLVAQIADLDPVATNDRRVVLVADHLPAPPGVDVVRLPDSYLSMFMPERGRA